MAAGQNGQDAAFTAELLRNVLGYQVRITHTLIKRVFHEKFQDFDLTNVEFGMLLIIKAMPRCSQRSASEALGTPATVAVHVIGKLIERGLVSRERDPDDRRNYNLALTAAGKSLVNDGLRRSRIIQSQMLAGLSDRDVATLFGALRKIQDNLRDILHRAEE